MPDALTAEVLAGPSGPEIGAFFDFDGTVIHGFSGAAFFRHRLQRGQVNPVELARALRIGLTVADVQEKYDQFLTAGFWSWRGVAADEMEELGQRLFRQEFAANIYPDAWELVQAHLRRGHTVALASSASRFQIEPVACELGIEHVVCTVLEEEDGLLTGRVLGRVAAGEGKAEAVRSFASAHGVDLDRSYGYANGDEDIAFLETVGRPRPVNPEDKLAQHASERGWPSRRLGDRGRPGLVTMGRSVAAFAGMGTAVGVGLGLGLLNRSRQQAVDLTISLYGDVGLALAGIDVQVDRGQDHLWAHRPAVFVFNHQSNGDALVLSKLLRGGFTGVAKKEAANQPIGGQFLRLAGVAFIDRSDAKAARAALEPAVERLRSGTSLVMAPEGTRSKTARLGTFKKGAFHVASQADVPVVPIVMRDVARHMGRSARTFRPGTVRVVVLPPVFPHSWNAEEFGDRVAEVEASIRSVLGDWPGPA